MPENYPIDMLDKVLAYEAIRNLKAKYFRYIDTRELDKWLDLFSDDVCLQWERYEDDVITIRSRNELEVIATRMLSGASRARTIHHGHLGEIDILDPENATAVWPMFDYVISENRAVQGYGFYHDTYVLIDGKWKIKEQYLQRIHFDELPGGR